GEFRLVRLQVPDEMPADAREDVGERRDLVARFLDAVLSEIGKSGRRRLAQPLDGDHLGRTDENDRRRIASRALGRARDSCAHRAQTLYEALQDRGGVGGAPPPYPPLPGRPLGGLCRSAAWRSLSGRRGLLPEVRGRVGPLRGDALEKDASKVPRNGIPRRIHGERAAVSRILPWGSGTIPAGAIPGGRRWAIPLVS